MRTAFDEGKVRRDTGGRFATQLHGEPDLTGDDTLLTVATGGGTRSFRLATPADARVGDYADPDPATGDGIGAGSIVEIEHSDGWTHMRFADGGELDMFTGDPLYLQTREYPGGYLSAELPEADQERFTREALWTYAFTGSATTATGETEPLDITGAHHLLTQDIRADIHADTKRFLTRAREQFTDDDLAAYTAAARRPGADDFVAAASHDFVLSRNGHGTGFWDRGAGDVGERLHALASSFGERNLAGDLDEDGRLVGLHLE